MAIISFYNRGNFELDFIRAHGVSAKVSDSPIGMFGTGLKYALAVLLRESQDVRLVTNGKAYDFGTKKKVLRDKEFTFVTMTGPEGPEQLSFTTDLGRNWTLENAYRELYCNAIDEAGGVHEGAIAADTVFSIIGEAFASVHANRHKFIFNPSSKPMAMNKGVEIYHGSSSQIFYRGIAAAKLEKPSLFTYNIVKQMELTEDRTLRSWEIDSTIMHAYSYLSEEHRMLTTTALLAEKVYESSLDFRYYSMGEEFMKAAEEAFKVNPVNMNPSAVSMVMQKKDSNIEYETFEMTPEQEKMLAVAWEIIGMEAQPSRYSLRLCKSLGADVIAMAKDETILLTPAAFASVQYLAQALYEEYVHLYYGYKDCDRQMQTFLFQKLIETWAQDND